MFKYIFLLLLCIFQTNLSQIVFNVSTNKNEYLYGDTVNIVSLLKNIGSQNDTLHFSGCVVKILVDSLDSNNLIICPSYPIRLVLNSNEEFSKIFQIPGYFRNPLSVGTHKIISQTTNYDFADTSIIDIVNSPTHILSNSSALLYYKLEQNYPNPFNPTTYFSFTIPTAQYLSLKVINLLGIELFTVTEGTFLAGTHRVAWNASNYPSGVYFYKMQFANYSITKKLLLLK